MKKFLNRQKTLILAIALFALLAAASARAETAFTIIHTSDEHSNLMPSPMADYAAENGGNAVGGFARLATLVEKIRRQRPEVPSILISSGDFIGGTPFSWLMLKDQTPELAIMSQLGYLITTLGNHEFDYGPDRLAAYLQRAASFSSPVKVIASNIVIPQGHAFAQAELPEHFIKKIDDNLSIGFFALLGKGAHRLSPSARPLDFSDQHTAAANSIKKLKEAGAHVIVAITHAGQAEDIKLAESVSGIDLILGGHDHIMTDLPLNVGKTIIMHSGYYLKTVGQLDFTWNPQTAILHLNNTETGSPFIHDLDNSVAEDPEIAAAVAGYLDQLNDQLKDFTNGAFNCMTRTIARSDFPLVKHTTLSETTVGNFITDAVRFEAARATGRKVDFAFHANGIIRGNIIPSTLAENTGNISMFDLCMISGLGSGPDNNPGYPLVSFYLTEAELMNMLEISTLLPLLWGDVFFLQVSGLSYQYDPARAVWFNIPFINKPLPAYRSIINAWKYTGEGLQNNQQLVPFDAASSKLYHVATTHYLATYLPMIGKHLPRLNIVLKNINGEPVELEQTIIRTNGRELKLWEATARYAASFATSSSVISNIPDYYRQTHNRIVVVKGPSLWFYPSLLLIIPIVGIILFFNRKRLIKAADITDSTPDRPQLPDSSNS